MTRLVWGAATDTGRVRQDNQDSYHTSDSLLAVADGMGGHRGGEVASHLAIDALQGEFSERSTDALVAAVQSANDVVVENAARDPDLQGMGTTLCALAPVDAEGEERLAVVNVGDSRVYLLKDGVLEQVTDDHSLVATLERQGRITRAEAAVHPQRNILTRALGIDARVMVDSWEVMPVVGDRYLLCSDGLFNEVDESRIASTMRRLRDPSDAAHELVRLANESGGRDNITVVVVDVVGTGAADSHAVADGAIDLTDSTRDRAGAGPADPADPAGPSDRSTDTRSPRGAAPKASERVVSAVSGEARATRIEGGGEGRGRGPSRSERRKADRATKRLHRQRTLTWRVVAFLIAVGLVAGAGAAAINYYGRHTYYVAFEGDAVTIYQGRPGGLLWIKAERAESTRLTRQSVPQATVGELEKGKIEPTLDDAHRYITNLEEQMASGTGGSIPQPTVDPNPITTTGSP